jgi:hypothetical protein
MTPDAAGATVIDMSLERFEFLVGRPVQQIWVWGPIRLVFELGDKRSPEAFVDIIDATLQLAGREVALDAFENRDQAGVVLQLLHERLASAYAEDGVLHLSFEGGAALRSLPNDGYESWTVVGDSKTFQCIGGGEVVCFGGQQ